MRQSGIRLIAVAALAALALAACSSSDKTASSATNPTTTTEAATTTTSPADTGPKTVTLASSSLGKILTDSKGFALYVFETDEPNKSNCSGGCLTIWPAAVAPAAPTYGAGLTASMFSTITRDDGTEQLTVSGQPLYLFKSDTKAGDVKGQGVGGFYVVGADGKKIEG